MAYKAFISSTFEDHKRYRKFVITALRRAGLSVDPMEEWTAATAAPKHFSQERLDGCDLCVLLVGFRRGHIPAGETSSITQLEYRAAIASGIDVLVFVLAEGTRWPREFNELRSDPGIRQWRAELQESKGVGFFGVEPRSIKIEPALARWIAEKQRSKGSPEARRQRVVLLKWLASIPQKFVDYFHDLFRSGYAKDRLPSQDMERLEKNGFELITEYSHIVRLLPAAFEQTDPSETNRAFFDEVFPSMKERAEACFKAQRAMFSGVTVKSSDGSTRSVSLTMIYSALEVEDHLKTLRIAAEEIVRQFPIDEIEEARQASPRQESKSAS